jgi:hypothetical protein
MHINKLPAKAGYTWFKKGLWLLCARRNDDKDNNLQNISYVDPIYASFNRLASDAAT